MNTRSICYVSLNLNSCLATVMTALYRELLLSGEAAFGMSTMNKGGVRRLPPRKDIRPINTPRASGCYHSFGATEETSRDVDHRILSRNGSVKCAVT